MSILNRTSIACMLSLVSISFSPPRQDTKLVRIVPKQMQIQFLRGASKEVWADQLYSPSNKKLYILSLEPELDVGRYVVGVDLVLRDAEEAKTDENLLSPAGNWHGLQPFNFMASDLLHGADKSAFGARRTIKVTSRRLNVAIQILDSKVRTSPEGTHEIDELKLSISADNLPNSQ
jgi:hypothetical protein